MSGRTVPERINEFLVRCAGRAYCDHCIQERLGLRWRQQVQLVTATLAVTSGYRRSSAICSTCAESKQVITYVAASQIAKPMLKLPMPVVEISKVERRRSRSMVRQIVAAKPQLRHGDGEQQSSGE
ncbi:hypothetical protein HZZ13_19310 [Bradyrhizobium sp. CNPSo 4010]|uniref:Uncharacterized protein n=1 Tax=Bradyrhizobium agreste TaxID=2751811 RepID=A0ABS0PSU7_9BRAD|nr:hypothetical protein [Bradyrhizobium agreste]MBH5399919.1 hypothetical protein [Bradyrhizobium agreste]